GRDRAAGARATPAHGPHPAALPRAGHQAAAAGGRHRPEGRAGGPGGRARAPGGDQSQGGVAEAGRGAAQRRAQARGRAHQVAGGAAPERGGDADAGACGGRGGAAGCDRARRHRGGPSAPSEAWGGPPPVKNTFIHFSEDYYPMPPEALVRLKTAPALLSFQEHSAAPGGASPPSFEPPPRGAAAQADDAGSVPPPWALKRTTSVQSNASAGRSRAASAAAPCGWEDGADHAGAPGKPGPLVRGSSAEVSRQLLEEKMGGPAAAAAGSEPSSPRALAAAADIRGLAPRAPLWRREVRLKNLPVLPEAELRTLVLAELERVWRTARAAGLPAVDELRLGAEGGRHPGGAGDAPASWAQAAQRAAGTEATVVFADADDASWLVDGRAGSSWAGPENLTLRGRPVQVEWASGAGAETDWRKLAYKAGTDASSHVSYGSEGTRRSCSGAVARKAAEQLARRAAEGGQAAAPPAAADRKNRTVMLEGLPRSLPIHHVVDEVSAQLRQLWTRDGYSAPELHGQGGIVVKKPLQGSRDENGGSCLVRFLWPAHARWLVEQKKIKIKVGAQDIQLRACWAKPREV
ncbi:unnamed protein product, partial [Prorocentrum cordatum]